MERCAIQNFNVGLGGVSISSDANTPNRLKIQLEGLIVYGGVVPGPVFELADVSYSCQSGSTVGSVSELRATAAQEQFLFLCVLNIDTAADCTDRNLVLDASVVISDNELTLGCERVAQLATSICSSTDNHQNLTPSQSPPSTQQLQNQIPQATPPLCGINGIQVRYTVPRYILLLVEPETAPRSS